MSKQGSSASASPDSEHEEGSGAVQNIPGGNEVGSGQTDVEKEDNVTSSDEACDEEDTRKSEEDQSPSALPNCDLENIGTETTSSNVTASKKPLHPSIIPIDELNMEYLSKAAGGDLSKFPPGAIEALKQFAFSSETDPAGIRGNPLGAQQEGPSLPPFGPQLRPPSMNGQQNPNEKKRPEEDEHFISQDDIDQANVMTGNITAYEAFHAMWKGSDPITVRGPPSRSAEYPKDVWMRVIEEGTAMKKMIRVVPRAPLTPEEEAENVNKSLDQKVLRKSLAGEPIVEAKVLHRIYGSLVAKWYPSTLTNFDPTPVPELPSSVQGTDFNPTVHAASFMGTAPEGVVFIDSPYEEVDFMLGHAQTARGLEIAVATMCVGETVLVRTTTGSGFSSSRRPPGVPPDAVLEFLFTLIRVEKETNLHQMTFEQKLDFVAQRRELGKALFAQGKPRSAARQYDKALTVLDDDEVVRKIHLERIKEVIVLLVNQALCANKYGDYVMAISLASKVIDGMSESRNVKARYQRAIAHRARQDWEAAARDFSMVISVLEQELERNKLKNDGEEESSVSASDEGTLSPAERDKKAALLQRTRLELKQVEGKRLQSFKQSEVKLKQIKPEELFGGDGLYADRPVVPLEEQIANQRRNIVGSEESKGSFLQGLGTVCAFAGTIMWSGIKRWTKQCFSNCRSKKVEKHKGK